MLELTFYETGQWIKKHYIWCLKSMQATICSVPTSLPAGLKNDKINLFHTLGHCTVSLFEKPAKACHGPFCGTAWRSAWLAQGLQSA
jgi:hypothetical protein